MSAVKIGDAYYEIMGKADSLKALLKAIPQDAENSAKAMQAAFRQVKFDIDTRIMKMSFREAGQEFKRLQAELDKKIALNFDVASIQATERQMRSVAGVLGGLKTTTSSYNMVGMNFNRILQDSPYFARSAAFGMQAIGNNVQMLVESYSLAIARGESFASILKSSFTGINGYLFAINMVISAIMAWMIVEDNLSRALDKNKFKLEDVIGDLNAYEKSLEEIKKQLSELDDEALTLSFDKATKKIGEFFVKIYELTRAFTNNPVMKQVLSSMGIIPSDKDIEFELKRLYDTIGKINEEQQKRIGSTGSRNFLEAELKKAKEAFNQGDTSKARITEIKSLQAQIDKIDDLIKKEKEKKFNTENLFKSFYDDINKESQAWRDAQEKILYKEFDEYKKVVKDKALQQEWLNNRLKDLDDQQLKAYLENLEKKRIADRASGVNPSTYPLNTSLDFIKNGKYQLNPMDMSNVKLPGSNEVTQEDIFNKWISGSEASKMAFTDMVNVVTSGFDQIQLKVSSNANAIEKIWKGMINSMIRDTLSLFAKWGIRNLLSLLPGGGGLAVGLFDFLSGKAGGGDVYAGVPYMVGEKGAEVFIPNTNGTIVPHNQINNFNGSSLQETNALLRQLSVNIIKLDRKIEIHNHSTDITTQTKSIMSEHQRLQKMGVNIES